MNDLECPYCGMELDVCHDDGFGYEEGVKHQMECDRCGNIFVFETSISFYYEPNKADCLNAEIEHDWKLSKTYPVEYSRMICSDCGLERRLTQEEIDNLLPKD